MSQFSREPSFYISAENSTCSIDVSNILPLPLSPRTNQSIPLPTNDQEAAHRASLVDAEIREREAWVVQTREYFDMRGEVLKEEDAVYAHDHIDITYTRAMYQNISRLEDRVIEQLAARMKRKACFAATFARYEQMTRLISPSAEEMKEKAMQWLNQHPGQSRTRGVSSSGILNAYMSFLHEAANKSPMSLHNVKFFSTATQTHCDGCKMRHFKKRHLVTKEFQSNFRIRKWQGDREISNLNLSCMFCLFDSN